MCKEKNTLVKLLSGKHYSLFRHTLVVIKAFISFKYVLLLDCALFNESVDFEGSTFYLLWQHYSHQPKGGNNPNFHRWAIITGVNGLNVCVPPETMLKHYPQC